MRVHFRAVILLHCGHASLVATLDVPTIRVRRVTIDTHDPSEDDTQCCKSGIQARRAIHRRVRSADGHRAPKINDEAKDASHPLKLQAVELVIVVVHEVFHPCGLAHSPRGAIDKAHHVELRRAKVSENCGPLVKKVHPPGHVRQAPREVGIHKVDHLPEHSVIRRRRASSKLVDEHLPRVTRTQTIQHHDRRFNQSESLTAVGDDVVPELRSQRLSKLDHLVDLKASHGVHLPVVVILDGPPHRQAGIGTRPGVCIVAARHIQQTPCHEGDAHPCRTRDGVFVITAASLLQRDHQRRFLLLPLSSSEPREWHANSQLARCHLACLNSWSPSCPNGRRSLGLAA
mmetsp:Transcript_7374/g.18873  ORF Transcript_7374/g.18873 Transcript_7374/m.18873 type:complete len:344 (+) Transcript_7374:335-1366(+)